MKLYISLIVCFFFFSVANAQEEDTLRTGTATPEMTINQDDTTNQVYYFYLNDFQTQEVSDEFEPVFNINPILSDKFQHQYLGNFGAPHYSLMYQPRIRRGFDMGYHSYDGYLITQKDVPFFNVEKPHTDALFSAATQEDAFIDVKFTSNTAKRSNSYIAYKRISHIGAYTHQQIRHTNYVTSTYWRSKKDNYLAFFSWAGNTIKQKNNGGIFLDTFEINELLYSDLYNNISRKLIPVNVESAQSEYDNHEITLSQYFSFAALKRNKTPITEATADTLIITDSLGIAVDTVIKQKRNNQQQPMIKEPQIPSKIYLNHQFSYKLEQIKFFDDDITNASDSVYGDFVVNRRGLRHYIAAKKYENQFKANLKLGNENSATVLLQPGLIYALYFIDQEPVKLNRNDLFVTARLNTKLREYFDLDANAQIGIGSNAGDYTLSGKLSSGIQDKASLVVTAMQQLYKPTLIQQQLFVSHDNIWDLQLRRTLETNVGGELTIPFLKLNGGVRYHLINNFIYFDDKAQPAQTNQALNIVQAYGKHKLTLGKFHFINEVAFQSTPSGFLPLPRIIARHNWYYQNYFFKAKSLLGQIGLQARYNSSYKGNNYMPVTGQFYLQNEVVLQSYYPIMDAYINAKVKRFYLFIKAENVLQPIVRRSYLTSPHYPGRDLFIRFGISWKFID